MIGDNKNGKMDNFLCDICGKKHHLNLLIEILEPEILYKMEEKERKERVLSINFFHIIDKSFGITRARLEVPIQGHDNFIKWDVWVKFDEFRDYVKKMKDLNNKSEIYLTGKLYTPIALYENDEGSIVRLKYELNGPSLPPLAEIVDNQSRLGNEYRKGISIKRLIGWHEKYYHPKKSDYSYT